MFKSPLTPLFSKGGNKMSLFFKKRGDKTSLFFKGGSKTSPFEKGGLRGILNKYIFLNLMLVTGYVGTRRIAYEY
jgi:hypothetical protein